MKLIAALSGGVDSSVAAARAIDDGHDVVGVHLALARKSPGGRERGCCTLDDARDARRVADILGIPFYVWDFAERFQETVMADFLDEYSAGRTPNPCLRCNEHIKFSAVLNRARALGFDGIVTGHYARLQRADDGPALFRAIDPEKDQSYVLAVVPRGQLAASHFPLGGDHKADVREEATRRGLVTAAKPDSHDICFIPDGDTAGYVVSALGARPGPIIDAVSSHPIGEHRGTFTVTIGQRRGLGLTVPAEDGDPRYVIDVDPQQAVVTVGPREHLLVHRIEAGAPRWLSAPWSGSRSGVQVQVRAHGEPVDATLTMGGGSVVAELESPIQGIAPGQALVVYDGDHVLASATIDATDRVRRPRTHT
jgi:tRNA-specific 2-thiouridylase